jgi:hypothetical protein
VDSFAVEDRDAEAPRPLNICLPPLAVLDSSALAMPSRFCAHVCVCVCVRKRERKRERERERDKEIVYVSVCGRVCM